MAPFSPRAGPNKLFHALYDNAAEMIRLRFPGKALDAIDVNECIEQAIRGMPTPRGAAVIRAAWEKTGLLGLWKGENFTPVVHDELADLAASKDPDTRPSMPPGMLWAYLHLDTCDSTVTVYRNRRRLYVFVCLMQKGVIADLWWR